jgi:hypothetical protein
MTEHGYKSHTIDLYVLKWLKVEEIYYADCFIHVQTFSSYDWQNKKINLEMVLNFNFRVVKVLLVKLVKQESQVHR